MRNSEVIRHVQEYCLSDHLSSYASGYQYHEALEAIDALDLKGKRVLDWGCGEGHFCVALKHKGIDVTGFSINKTAVFDREENFPLVLGNREDPVSLPFKDGEFDCVTSIGVLEHVRETGGSEVKSLAEVRRIVKPGGYFLCYHFPNRYSWIEWAAENVFKGKHSHPFRYTRKDIERILAESGFSLQRIKRYGVLPKLMLNRLPSFLSNSESFTRFYYACDEILSTFFSLIATNYLFVAQRKGDEGN